MVRYVVDQSIGRGLAIDVGANSGLFTLPLSQLFESVVAVEPNVERAHFLQRAISGNVQILCAACGEDSSIAKLRVPYDSKGRPYHSLGSIVKSDTVDFDRATGAREVRSSLAAVTTIDKIAEVISMPINFIKIDVEGFEENVIAGASNTINAHGPALFVEIENRHSVRPNGTYSQLADHGYSCLAVNRGKLQPCPTTAAFAASQKDERVVNFLFERKR